MNKSKREREREREIVSKRGRDQSKRGRD